jgi:hypothetical protein
MQDWSFYSRVGIAVCQRFLVEVDFWYGPPRDYSILNATTEFPNCLNCFSNSNFETSYHNRPIILVLRYAIIK